MPQPFSLPLFIPSTPAQMTEMVKQSEAAKAAPAETVTSVEAVVVSGPVDVPADTADAAVDSLGSDGEPAALVDDAEGVPSDED